MKTYSNRCLPPAPAGDCLEPSQPNGHRLGSAAPSTAPPAVKLRAKSHGRLVFLPLCCLLLAVCFPARAQYSLDWSTIDGGGGTSTGGVYTLSGTIGQPDVGAMSGGNYSLTGGFWSFVAAVQTPGAPLLRIVHTATNAVLVAWPNPSTGFVLQENSDLNSASWTAVTTPPIVVGEEKQVIVNPPAGTRFYRLQKP